MEEVLLKYVKHVLANEPWSLLGCTDLDAEDEDDDDDDDDEEGDEVDDSEVGLSYLQKSGLEVTTSTACSLID